MVTVEQAEQMILSHCRDYGTGPVPFEQAVGRVLAEDITADRDLPPCNRVTMDGIAIRYAAFENGMRSFFIKNIVAAGDKTTGTDNDDECIEIMTGAALPGTTDTVIRYEDLEIKNGIATVKAETIKKGQNIHNKGKDKKLGETVAVANQLIDAAVISMAASVGKAMLVVRKLPKVVIISTGDELVDVHHKPAEYQVRSSNGYTIRAVLKQYSLQCDMLHIPDALEITREKIKVCLEQYDVLLLSGGVSMGKFDFVPQILDELNVDKHFHKVKQRPGKPFWFGTHANGAMVFAFPGNPVSAFFCLHRYFIPWMEKSLGIQNSKAVLHKYAVLNADVAFNPPLQYFMQVKLTMNAQAQLVAQPVEGDGSGDFANLLDSDAFMELPADQNNFSRGDVYRVWPFKQII